jgi:hypothetical protein
MHVQGEAVGGAMVERVSLSHLRFALAESMDSTREVLGLLYPLLGLVDPALCALLRDEAELEEPLFALSWVLTWFSHDLCDVRAHPSGQPHPTSKPTQPSAPQVTREAAPPRPGYCLSTLPTPLALVCWQRVASLLLWGLANGWVCACVCVLVYTIRSIRSRDSSICSWRWRTHWHRSTSQWRFSSIAVCTLA